MHKHIITHGEMGVPAGPLGNGRAEATDEERIVVEVLEEVVEETLLLVEKEVGIELLDRRIALGAEGDPLEPAIARHHALVVEPQPRALLALLLHELEDLGLLGELLLLVV
jgi:hypothetical protein